MELKHFSSLQFVNVECSFWGIFSCFRISCTNNIWRIAQSADWENPMEIKVSHTPSQTADLSSHLLKPLWELVPRTGYFITMGILYKTGCYLNGDVFPKILSIGVSCEKKEFCLTVQIQGWLHFSLFLCKQIKQEIQCSQQIEIIEIPCNVGNK